MQHVRLTDQVIWFKHIEGNTLLERLKALQAEEEIHLEVGGVVGRWKRMRGGADGRNQAERRDARHLERMVQLQARRPSDCAGGS